jgi:hypothetical protein
MINVRRSEITTIRNKTAIILSLLVAFVISAWVVMSPTSLLTTNSVEVQDFANKKSTIQVWNNLSETHLIYSGGKGFDDKPSATSATHPIERLYSDY